MKILKTIKGSYYSLQEKNNGVDFQPIKLFINGHYYMKMAKI